ncbi:polyadenylate-binding protein-interacting protein 1 isoform X1 [Anoplophora glabripennis]|uniref:polyadenylate-binding protein-interacting protein 1 isoform X1 n=1 Tax=Anoplophora glabripennis TaxID=217634 RepID=UPI0008754E52|nr:polyadenylate-binding protein-interacting protein 1 isoform X1 [Anoplophora glabripennis]
MENIASLWDKNSEELQPLRLPKSTPDVIAQQEVTQTRNELNCNVEFPKSGNEPANTMEDIIAKSTLKVDAPEWYPSNCISNDCLEPCASVKNIYDENISGTSETKIEYLLTNDEDSPDIFRLKQIIGTLSKDPGQFDNLLDLFMETLQPYFEDILALSITAQLLVEQAIVDPNFRYTGARLCWYIEQNCPEFRAELHLKCKKQLEQNANKQNVLLFIAELYTQLPHLTIYGALLIECFKQLLDEGGNDNIKCICQALKLTGHSLEYSNKFELDEVVVRLKLAKESATGSVINLINSICTLRSSNWGYSVESSNDVDDMSDIFYSAELVNTTFYRTDGDAFTNEEREFLTAHLDSNIEYLSDNSDPDDLCDPEPEMDAEIQEAFKEFIQLSKH